MTAPTGLQLLLPPLSLTLLDSHVSRGGLATAERPPQIVIAGPCPGNPCPQLAPDLPGEARCRARMDPRDKPEGDGRSRVEPLVRWPQGTDECRKRFPLALRPASQDSPRRGNQ